jgi:hypothetical protein
MDKQAISDEGAIMDFMLSGRNMKAAPDFGCLVWIVDGTVLVAAEYTSGGYDLVNTYEADQPEEDFRRWVQWNFSPLVLNAKHRAIYWPKEHTRVS